MTHAASRLVPALAFSFAIALIRQASAAPLPCQVPAGFEIELVAGPPLIEHPTMAGFDDQGRLYVCDGPGSNLPAKEPRITQAGQGPMPVRQFRKPAGPRVRTKRSA